MGAYAILDHIPEVPRFNEGIKPSAVADENTLDGKSTMTVSATAKLLRGVRDAVNGFGLLRSIAGTLCTIPEYRKAWPSSHI